MKCFFFGFKAKRRSESAPVLTVSSTNNISSSGSGPSPRGIPELYKEKENSLKVFSLQELIDATNGLSRFAIIGEGGFGTVYKGAVRLHDDDGLTDPTLVAIKKLKPDSLQGHKEWLAEVQFLGVVSHPNLVKLLGYCSEDGERGMQRLLVYEYMPNGSLENHLFSKGLPHLSWKKRLQIILGAAQGLAYLHGGLEIQVIYRDFKSSNVLLDADFKPKLSDFGLVREGPTGDRTHVSTAVVGTYGYAAPEYLQTGHLKSYSDIWSFGVVLYEILTGRRALDRNRPKTEQKLLDWVKLYPVDSKRFRMIMDPKLGNQYPSAAARAVARLADRCLSKNEKDRPVMSEVVECLKQALRDSEERNDSREQ